MSEALTRDCQVNICEWTKRAFLLQKEPVNEEEISEPFARERRKVNGGHSL